VRNPIQTAIKACWVSFFNPTYRKIFGVGHWRDELEQSHEVFGLNSSLNLPTPDFFLEIALCCDQFFASAMKSAFGTARAILAS
jgi:hypothetical protein